MYDEKQTEKNWQKTNISKNFAETDWFTEEEAANYLRLSRSFLSHRRCEGKLRDRIPGPPFFKVGRNIRYTKKDLLHWIETHFIKISAA
jgi:hypothetical protein